MIKTVTKRDGQTIVGYDRSKIRIAIEKANTSVPSAEQISPDKIVDLMDSIEADIDFDNIGVEEIQDMVEQKLVGMGYYRLAKNYITYRYKRALVRQTNTTDDDILSLLRGENKDTQRENSNKNAVVNSTQRDLIAGETSKDITKRLLLPQYIVEAHEKGIIHFHDMDYFMHPEFNCCLPNFRDMLENGTTIHGVQIETPRSFRVACNQITQAMADISSNQYGGQTCYVDVLGKYLAITKDKFEKRIRKAIEDSACTMSKDDKEALIKRMVDEEIKIELTAGIQCIQYQINTLMTTNGQAPFVTLFMYLRDDDPYIEENAMIFEEIFNQRYDGFKNKQGVPVTPAFPKLVYVVGKNNCLKGGKYDYLTHLAAKCTAKRMYPDYISEKVMMENYDGEVFGCMGCVDGKEQIKYRYLGEYTLSTFEDFWNEMRPLYVVRKQGSDTENLYMDTPEGLEVWDTKQGWVKNRRIVRNESSDWVCITLDNGMTFHCTVDHPLKTYNRGVVEAGKLTHMGDYLIYNNCHKSHINKSPEDAYNDGVIVAVKNVRKYRQKKYSYDVTTLSDYFEVSGIYSHNCRSFLSAYKDPKTGEFQWEGRFNQGVVTLNLPAIALEADKDMDKFWSIFEQRLSLCYDALMCRHKSLEGTLSDVSPIHWQDGAIARLQPGEVIDPLLHDNYSSISLGYIGLYECVKHMTGYSHTEDIGREFSLRIMHRLRDATDSWKKATKIGFALYGTPAESTCYTLCKKDRERFGEVKDVTDKPWYTNSYHIDVREPITAFEKLEKEAIYQKISAGGALSYVEIPNMMHNLEAIEEVIKFIYEHVQYGEFNTKSDYCTCCGFDGEIELDENDEWVCPNCGCRDMTRMSIVRRTCGYLGTNGWNEGKTAEIGERVIHLY